MTDGTSGTGLSPNTVGAMSTSPRIFQRTGPENPVSPGGGYKLSVAARFTPSPPRECPTSKTFDRSAAGASRTICGAVARALPDQSAQCARCSRTSDDRACAPPSSAAWSSALIALAEMDTVRNPCDASSSWVCR